MAISHKVVSAVGVISHDGECSKEVKLISWNDRKPQVDIRNWRGDRPLKGLVLTREEALKLIELLKRAVIDLQG